MKRSSRLLHATTIPTLPNYNQRSKAFRHQATETFAELSVDQDA